MLGSTLNFLHLKVFVLEERNFMPVNGLNTYKHASNYNKDSSRCSDSYLEILHETVTFATWLKHWDKEGKIIVFVLTIRPITKTNI